MIISGGSRSNWRYFAKHLMKTEENERVVIPEIRGLFATNVRDAFRAMDAIAMGSDVTNFFYHADINPREGEELTPEQWEQAVDTLEKNLRLDGQPRFVVEHEKEGRTHRHVVWLRVDLDTMKAIPDSWDYRQHQKTSRTLEQAFGLEPVNGVLGPDGKRVKRRPKNYETRKGKETGITPEAVAADLSALWTQCDTGPAFAAALEERGYTLARGDRRDFVVVDPAANEHALSRRLGVKAAEVRDRLADVDRDALPTVAEARAMARERASEGRDERSARPAASERQSRAMHPVVEEVVYSATERAFVTRERPARKVAHGSEQKPAPPAPAPKPEPSLFQRLAKTLTEAAHFLSDGPTAAESLDMHAHPAPGGSEASPFERAAAALIQEAKQAAPVIEGLAAVTATVVEHRPTPEPALSAFERLAEEHFEAVRQAGSDGLFIPEGLTWLAEETGTPLLPDAPPDGERGVFDRMTRRMHEAARDNGGEPEPGFWQRSIALLSDLRDRTTEWMEKAARSFSERITRGRANDPEQPGRER